MNKHTQQSVQILCIMQVQFKVRGNFEQVKSLISTRLGYILVKKIEFPKMPTFLNPLGSTNLVKSLGPKVRKMLVHDFRNYHSIVRFRKIFDAPTKLAHAPI